MNLIEFILKLTLLAPKVETRSQNLFPSTFTRRRTEYTVAFNNLRLWFGDIVLEE
jgi:hypothetical protein